VFRQLAPDLTQASRERLGTAALASTGNRIEFPGLETATGAEIGWFRQLIGCFVSHDKESLAR